jgi:hypothetical protein
MNEENNSQNDQMKKKGMFDRLNWLQKIAIFIIVVIGAITVIALIFTGTDKFYQFVFNIAIIIGCVAIIYFIIQATTLIFTRKQYSPREDLRTKYLNMATFYKPDNVRDLYFTGDVGKKKVLAGKIIGLLGIPYFIGDVVKDDKGKVVYTERTGLDGRKMPKYDNIRIADGGDTLFIVEKGFLFKKRHYIRCNFKYHGTLNGDVEIFDINPQSYGFFEYPYKQFQNNIGQIAMQNQLETIIATYEHQHDFISTGVDSAVFFNPAYRIAIKQGAEMPEE